MIITRLQYITNGNSESEILEEVSLAVDAGVEWIQLRIKNPSLDVLKIGKKVRELCHQRAVFIMNDHVEIALSLDADGVHLGLTDMPIPIARNLLGNNKIIGGTANTYEDCLNRINDGANYIGLGPYKHTTTKRQLSPIIGLKGYQTIVNEKITVPVIAIGGIKLEDVKLIMNNSNIYGIAVSSLIKNERNKRKLIVDLNEALGGV